MLDSKNWETFKADCRTRTLEDNRQYHEYVNSSFDKLIHMGIWRTVDENRDPIQFIPIHHMEPTNMKNALMSAKNSKNYLIINAIQHAYSIIEQKANNTLSKLNNNNKKQKTMSTSKTENVTERNQNTFRYSLNDVVTVAGKDSKVRDVIITFRQEALVENGYRSAYRYKVKGSNGDNSALYSQRDMIDMENRATRLEKSRNKKTSKKNKPRDLSQKFEVNKTYGRYTIVNHEIVKRAGKRNDGTLTISDSITGHRYDVTVDGGNTIVTFTQTELSKAIERENKAVEASSVTQSELNFDASENVQLRAENHSLKRMIAEIHEKLNLRASTAV